MVTLDDFEAYDRDNPHVWAAFVLFTDQVIDRGFKHFSADAVLHRVRWETAIVANDPQGFKVNDHYSAFYARKFHDMFPHLAGFFRTRVQRHEQSSVSGGRVTK